MANAKRGEYTLKAGGKNYTYRMDYNMAVEAETMLGKGLFEALEVGNGHIPPLGVIRTVFFMGARGQHGIETLDDAGRVLGSGEPDFFHNVASTITESVIALFPVKAENKPETEKKEGN